MSSVCTAEGGFLQAGQSLVDLAPHGQGDAARGERVGASAVRRDLLGQLDGSPADLGRLVKFTHDHQAGAQCGQGPGLQRAGCLAFQLGHGGPVGGQGGFRVAGLPL
jgi:hypothetical protein